MEWALALVAIALLGVAAVSGRLSGTPITPAILFVAFGLLVGPEVLDGIDLSSSGATVRGLAEVTLALVLFSDARRASTSVRYAGRSVCRSVCSGSAYR
jgi:NhaP-type Na+/H+ or K+/H+ antiporter